MMKRGKMLSVGVIAWPLKCAQSPIPTNRNNAICAKTMMPLPMIARWASRRFRGVMARAERR